MDDFQTLNVSELVFPRRTKSVFLRKKIRKFRPKEYDTCIFDIWEIELCVPDTFGVSWKDEFRDVNSLNIRPSSWILESK